MATQAFRDGLRFVLRWEGGFVDDPADPGGRTNRGVTQKTYDGWRARSQLLQRDVLHIEEAEVEAIYETDYWGAAGCDRLRASLDLIAFDTAVNMGVRRSIKILQTSLGCEPDGKFGRLTLAAAAGCDLGATAATYCKVREGIYRNLAQRNPNLGKFLQGWLNRLNSLRKVVGLPALEVAGPSTRSREPIVRIPDLAEDQPLEQWH